MTAEDPKSGSWAKAGKAAVAKFMVTKAAAKAPEMVRRNCSSCLAEARAVAETFDGWWAGAKPNAEPAMSDTIKAETIFMVILLRIVRVSSGRRVVFKDLRAGNLHRIDDDTPTTGNSEKDRWHVNTTICNQQPH